MRPNRLDSVDPVKLAWLLRADLRRGLPAGAPIPEWFQMWWVIEGTREYPAWADRTPASAQHLFYPSPDWPSYGVLGVTPAMLYLRERRKDLQEGFDLDTQRGQWELIAWFYSHGVREYKLGQRLGQDILDALDDTPPFLQNAEDTAPPLTWLMYFTWFGSAELQEAFDLRTLKGKQDFLQWYLFDGVPNFRHAALISRRWKNWLEESIRLEGVPLSLTRATLLLWHRDAELNQQFDIRTHKGSINLANRLAHSTAAGQFWWNASQESGISQKSTRPMGINLIGFAYGELGIGEDVRMAAAACHAANIPYVVINIDPGKHLRQADLILRDDAKESIGNAIYSINVFCLTGFDTARVALEKGPDLFAGKVNIGWWPWELPIWPANWNPAFDLVDEIWAATSFTYSMYAKALHKASPRVSLRLVPMAASVNRLVTYSRKSLGLPDQQYLFLYVFDFNSYIKRKNPFAAVQAFKKAFPLDDKSVGLVIKTMNQNYNDPTWKRFLKLCSSDHRIQILQNTMDRGKLLGLINSCDAYLSLHRSEGFGRTLAEAMLLGKPVIATGFSGNMDFMHPGYSYSVTWRRSYVKAGDYPFISDADKAWWGNPIIDDAAGKLILSRAESRRTTKQRKNYAAEKFSPEYCGLRMKNIISSHSFIDARER